MALKAYFLTWTTYGTWLPGDSRGWVDRKRTHGEICESGDPGIEDSSFRNMREPPVLLGDAMRKVVAETIHAAALHHCWSIHALNVRSNHVHIVISAPDQDAGYVMRILKGRSSLALSAIEPRRRMWWTRQGSKKRVYSDASLEAAVRYVANQDKSWLNDT